MRELNINEVESVVGGVLFLAPVGVALAFTLVTSIPNGYTTQVCGADGQWGSFNTYIFS